MKNKTMISCLLVAVAATVCFAFAQPGSEKKTTDPVMGFFSFNENLGEPDDADAYEYVGATLPVDGCSGSLIICTIEATVDERNSEDPDNWKPDFSAGNPVGSPTLFNTITKRD